MSLPVSGQLIGLQRVQSRRLFKASKLSDSDVYLAFDRYIDHSTKSITRAARGMKLSRVHQLNLKSPLPARDSVLKCTQNKVQLNHLLCRQILNENNFLKNITQDHHLVVTGDDAVPTEVFKRYKTTEFAASF